MEKEAAAVTMPEDGKRPPAGILKSKLKPEEKAAAEKLKEERSPMSLLTPDGKRLANPWYLPHDMELAVAFDGLGLEEQLKALRYQLDLSFRIHDILMYLCAHARLGSSHARLGTRDVAFIGVGADWGGTEGIGAELRTLRRNLSQLKNPTDPVAASAFFEQRRQVVYLEWVLTCQFVCIKELFE